jgi:galactose mutarotase-like enzyme
LHARVPRIVETTFKNIPALQLSDDCLRLTVIPEWGGKVSELFDLRRQREWLFENPALPYRLPEYGGDYVREFDVGGLDECFPTVGPCAYPTAPWDGTPLPDHGEVWSIPWAVRVYGETLHLTTHGVRLPYRLEKMIRLLGDGGVRFTYRVTNLSPFPMPFLWSSHPLFALRPGMRLALPAASMRVFSAPSFLARGGDVIPWPRFKDLDLGRVPQSGAGIAAKLFSFPLTEGWAELSDPADGATFRFEFDPAVVTHLGLWLNYSGWAGVPGAAPYFNLAIEPCIGAPDTLDTAVNHWQEYGLLPPGASLDWWLHMISC